MPWFSDPADPPDLKGSGWLLLRNGGLLLDLFGWMTVAVGVSEEGSAIVWIALAGAIAGLLQLRALIASGVIELSLLAGLLALAPPGRTEWVWTGAVLIATARALSLAWRRLARARGEAPPE